MSDPRLEATIREMRELAEADRAWDAERERRRDDIDQLAEAITRDALLNYAHGMEFTAAVKGAAVYHLGDQ